MAWFLPVAAGAFAAHIASKMVNPWIKPAERVSQQVANWKMPVEYPSADAAINAFNRGYLTNDECNFLTRMDGVDFKGIFNNYRSLKSKSWGAVALAKLLRPGPSELIQAFQRGVLMPNTLEYLESQLTKAGAHIPSWYNISGMLLEAPGTMEIVNAWMKGLLTEEEFIEAMRRAGADTARWRSLIPAMYAVPGASDWLGQWRTNRIDERTFRAKLKRDGVNVDEWMQFAEQAFEPLSVGEVLMARNRGLMNDDNLEQFLRFRGYKRPEELAILNRLREEIPGPGDLVRFGVAHSFQPEIAGPLQLYDERPEQLDKWHNAVGLHVPLEFNIPSDGVIRPATWADMYWSAHWRKLGYETLATFLHRFRPDQIARYRAMGYNVDTFDLEKFKTLIRIDDYPKYARDYLAAISFRPLDSRWAIRGYTYDVLRPAQIKNVFLDQGYDSDRAQQATDIVIAQKEYRDRAPERAFELAQIRKAAVEIERAYEVGTVDVNTASDALTAAFHSRPASEMALRTIDLKVRNGLLKAVIANVRHSYIAGAITDVEALAYLRNANVAEPRIALYLQGWITERGSVRKTATSAQILRWLQVGLIDAATAAIRLANLGWSNVDNLIQLAETGQKINKATVAAQAKDEKARAAQAKHLEALHKQAVAATKAIEGRVAKLTPVAKMQKWLAAGNITEQYFLNRLQAMGIPPDVRILMLKEAQGGEMRAHAAEAKARRAAEKTARGKDESLGTVKRWFTFGIIPEVAAREEMGILGVPQEDQDKYILQWEIDAQPKKDRPAAPAPPQGQ